MQITDRPGMFCKLCEFTMSTSLDFESYKIFGVCRECSTKFAECRKKEWKKGWVPDSKSLSLHKKDIAKRIFPLLSKIDNYI